MQMDITRHEAELNGNVISYNSETEFLIQVSKSKHPKSGYETTVAVRGNLEVAVLHYNMINVGDGYKKRLLAPKYTKPRVLDRQTSETYPINLGQSVKQFRTS